MRLSSKSFKQSLLILGVIIFAVETGAARPLYDRLLSLNKRTRDLAHIELSKMHTGEQQELVPDLVEGLYDPDYHVCNVAAYALSQIGKPAYKAIPAIIDNLQNRLDCKNLTSALRGIGRPSVPALISLLKQEDEKTRHLSSKALIKMGYAAREAIPVLKNILDQTDEFYGIEYAPYLARIQPQEVVPYLVRILRQGEYPIRKEAAGLLAAIGPEAQAAIPALTKSLDEKTYFKSEDWRPECARALGNMGELASSAVPRLIRALDDNNEKFKQEAAKALEKIGTPQALAALTN